MNMTQIYVMAIGVAAVVLFIWFKFSKKISRLFCWVFRIKRKQANNIPPPNTPVPKEELIWARVYDCDHRVVGNKRITRAQADEIIKKHGTMGRQWYHVRSGKRVYALKYKDGEGYSPAPTRPSNASGTTPREVSSILSVDKSINLFWRPTMPKDNSTKVGTILIWSGALIFIVFMAVTNK